MEKVLQLFILFPLLATLAVIFLPGRRERWISKFAITIAALYFIGISIFWFLWLFNSTPTLNSKHFTFFKADNIEIFIDFYFDKVTAVYAFVGSLVTLLVAVFSRFYLHRDEGFRRFFSTILLFFAAYNIIIFSGNFETLFMGWEILGITSFLLIAFYRDRYLPVKNGLKVISIYRLGDVCLILAMWMSHQLWHENITFFKLNDSAQVSSHIAEYYWYAVFLSIVVVLAAATKSAQLPFSSWLPRAMEGPTTSSAIFYGALSVHLGVFLLLRTYPYWQNLAAVKLIIIAIGLLTSLIAASIARVQSTVKTQIAYASITQIGLIFIEVALGWHILALIHFAGNALLRTYQMLVSPSVLSYLIHDMVFNFKPNHSKTGIGFMSRIRSTIYMLSIKEWNLDTFLYKFLWSPFKIAGARLKFLSNWFSVIVLVLAFGGGLLASLYSQNIPSRIYQSLPVLFSVLGLLLILGSFSERQNAKRAWTYIIAAQFFIALSIALVHEGFGLKYLLIYLSGTFVAAIVGFICLAKLQSRENEIDLNRFHGNAYEHPGLAFAFLISCLGLVGFPFTPTFIGIDILYSHIHKQEILLIIFTSLSFIFMELAALRIYARLFLGQHKKAYHPIAYRTS